MVTAVKAEGFPSSDDVFANFPGCPGCGAVIQQITRPHDLSEISLEFFCGTKLFWGDAGPQPGCVVSRGCPEEFQKRYFPEVDEPLPEG